MRVIVIGAGLGGLSAALHLRGAGHDVLIVEKMDQPGGRCTELHRDGYRFDLGPTVMTMPELLARPFTAAGLNMTDFVTLKKVDPMYRAVYADGSQLMVKWGRDAMAAEIRDVCGAKEAASFHKFADWLTELYHLEMDRFIDANFDSPLDLAFPPMAGLKLVKHGGFRKLGKVARSYFDDDRLRRIFTFQAMYAGLAPMQALAVYGVITYMDCLEGVTFPEGGMHAIAKGMADGFEKVGGEIRLSAPVASILREQGTDGRVLGVELQSRERLLADAVVANPDLPVAYRELLGGVDAPRVARRGKYSPSCVLWHAGVKGLPPKEAAHHNIHFGADWDGAFKALIDDGVRMPDPSILITLHSLDCPTDAPPGNSTLYVLEPTPNLDGKVDWVGERERVREQLVQRVGALGYPVDIEVEEFVDPLDWERQGMERGTPFGLSHTFFQTGPFRPNNINKRVPGLVFVGSSTLPGVGVPMVLVSGGLAAQRVEEYARSRRA
jgi:phytoene desaturase